MQQSSCKGAPSHLSALQVYDVLTGSKTTSTKKAQVVGTPRTHLITMALLPIPSWAVGWENDFEEDDAAASASTPPNSASRSLTPLAANGDAAVRPSIIEDLRAKAFGLRAPSYRPLGTVWFKASLPPAVKHCLIFIELVPWYMLCGRQMEFAFYKLVLGGGRTIEDAKLITPRPSTDDVQSLHFNLKSQAGTGDKRDSNLHVLVHRVVAFTFLQLPATGPPQWDDYWHVDHRNDDHTCNMLRNLDIMTERAHMSKSGRKRRRVGN